MTRTLTTVFAGLMACATLVACGDSKPVESAPMTTEPVMTPAETMPATSAPGVTLPAEPPMESAPILPPVDPTGEPVDPS